jgi:hypothetical protein
MRGALDYVIVFDAPRMMCEMHGAFTFLAQRPSHWGL